MSGFIGGLLHPLAMPAHALALLALGLLIGEQHAERRPLLLTVFAAGLVAGLTAIALAVGETPAADVLLAAAVLTGALVALARPLPALACALLAAVTGAALGLDSPPEAISLALGTITLIGTGLGATIALTVVAAAAGYLVRVPEHVWLRTGVRVLGSWMAASALLVLALRLARGQLF